MRLLYLFVILLFHIIAANAQTTPYFQWGKSGCGSHSPLNPQPARQLLEVAPNGTVYQVTRWRDKNYHKAVDGVATPDQWGYAALTAHDNRGNRIWMKFFGSYNNRGGVDKISTDNTNSVIIQGWVPPLDSGYYTGGLFTKPYIYPDTVFPYNVNGSMNQRYYLCKFDNNGNLLWFKWLERNFGANPINYKRTIAVYKIDCDEQNNIILYAALEKDTFFNGALVTDRKYNLTRIHLDPQGNYLFHTPYDVEVRDRYPGSQLATLFLMGANQQFHTDKERKKLYLSFNTANTGDTFLFGNHRFEFTSHTDNMAIWMQYDWEGNLEWLNYSSKDAGTTGVATDELGYVYTTLDTRTDTILRINDTFDVTGHGGISYTSVIRFDSTGKNIKFLNSISNTIRTAGMILTSPVYHNNSLSFGAAYIGDPPFWWGGATGYVDKDTTFSKDYELNVSSPGLVNIDADNGKLNYLLTIPRSANSYEATLFANPDKDLIRVDDYSNVYLGGLFKVDTLYFSQNVIHNHAPGAGREEVYWGKLAYNNGDCQLPNPDFNIAQTGSHEITLTYLGSSTGLNQMMWSWGDDNKTYNQPYVRYVYNTKGVYRVCLNVANSCGPAALCKLVDLDNTLITDGQQNDNQQIAVYPNPANEHLQIQSIQSMSHIAVYNVLGQMVYENEINNALDYRLSTTAWAGGTYSLLVRDKNGQVHARKIVIVK